MKYQIYLSKDVSTIINQVSSFYGKKPSTFIKELLEDNFLRAYKDAKGLNNEQRK